MEPLLLGWLLPPPPPTKAVRWNSYTLTSGSNWTTGSVLARGLSSVGLAVELEVGVMVAEFVLVLILVVVVTGAHVVVLALFRMWSEPGPEYSATLLRHDLRRFTKYSVDDVLRTSWIRW